MKKAILLSLCMWAFTIAMAQNYSYSDIGQKYPLVTDNGDKVVSGFISLQGKTDKDIFANALLWAIENVSPKRKEGINNINFNTLSFDFDWAISSSNETKSKNVYYFKAKLKVSEGTLVYYISNIVIESSSILMKKVVSINKLQPEKKESHKQLVDGFIDTESSMLNQLFDYLATNKLQKISHWDEIKIAKAVKGMNEDECRLAFGKPQAEVDYSGEIQWMYSSSFYLFFKNGILTKVIK
jgi:hypothetical protein